MGIEASGIVAPTVVDVKELGEEGFCRMMEGTARVQRRTEVERGSP